MCYLATQTVFPGLFRNILLQNQVINSFATREKKEPMRSSQKTALTPCNFLMFCCFGFYLFFYFFNASNISTILIFHLVIKIKSTSIVIHGNTQIHDHYNIYSLPQKMLMDPQGYTHESSYAANPACILAGLKSCQVFQKINSFLCTRPDYLPGSSQTL